MQPTPALVNQITANRHMSMRINTCRGWPLLQQYYDRWVIWMNLKYQGFYNIRVFFCIYISIEHWCCESRTTINRDKPSYRQRSDHQTLCYKLRNKIFLLYWELASHSWYIFGNISEITRTADHSVPDLIYSKLLFEILCGNNLFLPEYIIAK